MFIKETLVCTSIAHLYLLLNEEVKHIMHPLISVIVPVYNTEAYLHRCLDSLINQTLSNIEILCVNDASTDNSLAILHKYAALDKRITILDLKQNKGEAGARNAAFPIAQGKYIGFVDSDDAIDVNFYETLYATAESYNADITKANRQCIAAGGHVGVGIDNAQVMKNKYNFSYEFTTAIYRLALLRQNNILFPLGVKCNADLFFLFKAITNAQIIAVANGVFYNYYRREDSANSAILSMEKIKSIIFVSHACIDYLNDFTVNTESYVIAFMNKFNSVAFLLGRVTPEDYPLVSELLAENLCQLYAKCIYKDSFLQSNTLHMNTLLINNDIKGLAKGLLQRINPTQRVISNLRARLIKQKS